MNIVKNKTVPPLGEYISSEHPTTTAEQTVYIKVDNGAVGPTKSAIVIVEVSPDGADWYPIATRHSSTDPLAVAMWGVLVRQHSAAIRVRVIGGESASVVVDVQILE
ncbi:hypothetical protein [Denitromonas halophila]|uniref:Uncharacterized protein n=1 Tax=Denitromonas halophila TaxID=1629404 RepID=A0A557QX85_9RHOO|nr:hypothetical protein [Denitromonas halophila]TVO57530.1 hypothetical protein FHP91_07590 [Denitromonas halophila]